MDVMRIRDLLIVGVPEIVLCGIIAMQLLRGRDWIKKGNGFFKSPIVKIILNISKIILLSICIVGCQFFVKKYIDNIIWSGLINTVIHIIWYMIILRMRFIQAFILAIINGYIIIIGETLFIEPVLYIKNLLNLKGFFYDFRFLWTSPTRILQTIIIVFIYASNIKFTNNVLFIMKWNKLSRFQKTIMTCLMILLFTTLMISANYIEFIIKIEQNNIDNNLFYYNLKMFIVATLVYITVSILLLIYVFDKENLSNILYREPSSLIRIVLKVCSIEQVIEFSNIITEYLNEQEVNLNEK